MDLKLPAAIEKSQPAAFTTVCCGVQYYSKTGVYGAPPSKWAKLKAFYAEHCVKPSGELKEIMEASILQTLLGKFAHFITLWPAGRPCMYYLWKLLNTAGTWKNGRFSIHRANKLLRHDNNCEISHALGELFGNSHPAGKTNASVKYRNEGFLGYLTPDVTLEKPFNLFCRDNSLLLE